MTGDPHLFQTDTVKAELRHRAMRSGAIAAAARVAQITLQLGATVVLARLLTPRDFGIQAMVLPITILFNGIINLAFQMVLIQREDLDDRAASAMFWLGIRVNLVLAASMALTGVGLSRVYRTPEVIWVAAAWSTVLYLASSAAVPEALLKRQLRFGVVWSAQLAATTLGTAIAIGAAMAGAKHWALMLQIAISEVGRAVIVWIASGWRPSRPLAGESKPLESMRHHWLRLSGFRVVSRVGDQLDRVVAGVVGGAGGLGLYETAKRWAFLPFFDLFLSLSDVAVSSLSRVQNDPPRYRRYLEYALLGLLTASLPVIVFILLEAGPIVELLLGDQWLGAVPFLRLMAVAAIGASLIRPMQWLYFSLGESARQLRWTAVTSPLMITGALLGSRYGTYGVAVGFTVATGLLVIPSLAYALQGSPVRAVDLGRAIGRPLGAAALAGALLLLVRPAWSQVDFRLIQLGSSLIVFGTGYAAAWLALPGGAAAARELARSVREIRGPGMGRPWVATEAAARVESEP